MKSKGTVGPLTLRQELNNITGAEAETPPAGAADTASHASVAKVFFFQCLAALPPAWSIVHKTT